MEFLAAFIECQNGFGCYNLIGSYPQGDEKAQAEIFAAIDSFQSSGPAGTISQRFYDERLPFQFIYWESDGEITFNVVNENRLRMVNEAGNVQVEIQCRPSSDQFNKEVWLDGIAEVMVNQPGLKREEGRWEHETGGIDWIVDRYTYTLDGQTAYTEVYAGEIDGYVFAITASAYTEEALITNGMILDTTNTIRPVK